MSKLPEEHKFIDLSDYGRPFAKVIAHALKNTLFTPIHLTIGFIIAGLFAVLLLSRHPTTMHRHVIDLKARDEDEHAWNLYPSRRFWCPLGRRCCCTSMLQL